MYMIKSQGHLIRYSIPCQCTWKTPIWNVNSLNVSQLSSEISLYYWIPMIPQFNIKLFNVSLENDIVTHYDVQYIPTLLLWPIIICFVSSVQKKNPTKFIKWLINKLGPKSSSYVVKTFKQILNFYAQKMKTATINLTQATSKLQNCPLQVWRKLQSASKIVNNMSIRLNCWFLHMEVK